jgi:hypothetical protein
MDLSQARTRLRKTFKHREPDDLDDNGCDGLGEQQQEQLITSLRQSSTSTDLIYTRTFTALPLIATVPLLWHFIPAAKLLPTLLNISSLAATA